MKSEYQCVMIATDGLYLYKLTGETSEMIMENNLNPFGPLINNLQKFNLNMQDKAFNDESDRESVSVTIPTALMEFPRNTFILMTNYIISFLLLL